MGYLSGTGMRDTETRPPTRQQVLTACRYLTIGTRSCNILRPRARALARVYVCVCGGGYVHMCAHVCDLCVCVSVCLSVCVSACLYVRLRVCVSAQVYARIVCVCVLMCIYIVSLSDVCVILPGYIELVIISTLEKKKCSWGANIVPKILAREEKANIPLQVATGKDNRQLYIILKPLSNNGR